MVVKNKNSTECANNDSTEEDNDIVCGLDDAPPWYLCIFMALQHYLTMIGAIVSIPFILTPALCMKEDDPAKGYIISTMIFVTGIVTFIQVTFGCRLPIVQGGTISFLIPTLAILHQPQWRCPSSDILNAMSAENRTELWQLRMRELSGAIIVSAVFQTIIGYCGIIGMVLKFVTPITIVCAISLVGLSLFEIAAESSSKHWGIAMLTIFLLTVFSLCMSEVKVPLVGYRKGYGLKITWFRLFKLFPVLLTIVIMWVICGVLTATNYLPSGHPARTDTKIDIVRNAAWIRIPYPGQWGWPTVSISSVLGMMAGVLACTVESLGYYPTVAKMSGGPPPPVHVINRGIGTEGLGTILAGIWGSGNGANTFGENVGTIGVTRIGSRRVIQFACLLMLLQGVINKFGAVFIVIPEPIIGGIFCVMFGMIAAIGLSTLQYVNLNSARNLYIIGFCLFFSLVLPRWMIAHPNAINTGNATVNNAITVLLSTSILVGGFLGCLMDNVIPGTLEERGIIAWADQMKLSKDDDTEAAQVSSSTYDFPIGMNLIRRWKWTSFIPCSPTYKMKL
ncbi:solute carrier family 23 member 1-like [Planococcus citri]|uniref:solute carrier family 23 member 1-like n=1 Tax=Planococcus citri TaxID=170843 RepID=UPI0031F8200A